LHPLVYICMWWLAIVKSEFPLRLDYGWSAHAYVKQRLQRQLELLMMSGVPLETCWAFNEQWNNKFYYKVTSCWLFILSHTAMHGSMNIKLKKFYSCVHILLSSGHSYSSCYFLLYRNAYHIARWETELSGVKLGDIASRFIVLYKLYKSQK
jgi:hypothetical protein